MALLQILHWFNPVLWLIFRRIRLDREPATDALVLSHAGEEQKERYGHTLLKLLEHFQQHHSLPGLVGILEDQDQLKVRFRLIAKYTRGAYGWSLLALGLILVVAAVFLTKERLEQTEEAPGVVELFDAVWQGNVARTKNILKQGVDPNAPALFEGSHQGTALYYCADFNYPEVAQVLLEHGANPNLPNDWNDLPIMRALWRGYTETARVLKEGGAKVKPEFWAVSVGEVDTLRKLSEEGVIKKSGTAGLMSFAVASGQLKSIQYLEALSEKKVSPHLLEMAARTGQVHVMKYILLQGATLEKEGSQALSSSLHWNQHRAAQWLIDQGLNITIVPENEEPPLLKAQDARMVELLLKAGADPNLGIHNRLPLTSAPDLESIDLLLKAGAKLPARSANGFSPILNAINYKTNPEVIIKLIDLGIPFDIQKDGAELCRAAAYRRNLVPLLRLLLSKGLRPDLPVIEDTPSYYREITPLHESVRYPHVLKELLKVNPNLEVMHFAKDKMSGKTFQASLWDYALTAHPESIKLLIHHGIKVPEWAFVYAASGDWPNLHKRILEGFDPKSSPNEFMSKNVLDIASYANQTQIIDELLKGNYVNRSDVFGGLKPYCVRKPMVDFLLSIAKDDAERETVALYYGLWSVSFSALDDERIEDLKTYMRWLQKPLPGSLLVNAINNRCSIDVIQILISKGIDLNGETVNREGKKIPDREYLQQSLDLRANDEVKKLIQPLLNKPTKSEKKELKLPQ
ncbi:MAG: hypothetical protein HC904_14815 [Blastochloris sp.]|nr:hypothetical protein [Blastochloris sp.]